MDGLGEAASSAFAASVSGGHTSSLITLQPQWTPRDSHRAMHLHLVVTTANQVRSTERRLISLGRSDLGGEVTSPIGLPPFAEHAPPYVDTSLLPPPHPCTPPTPDTPLLFDWMGSHPISLFTPHSVLSHWTPFPVAYYTLQQLLGVRPCAAAAHFPPRCYTILPPSAAPYRIYGVKAARALKWIHLQWNWRTAGR